MRCGEHGCTAEAVGGFYWLTQELHPACARHLAWAREVARNMGFPLPEIGQDVIDAQAAEEVRGMLERERMAEKLRNFGDAYNTANPFSGKLGVTAMQVRGPRNLGPPLTEAQVRASSFAPRRCDAVSLRSSKAPVR